MDRYARLAMPVMLVFGSAVGCTSKTSTVPNPFNTADRVPPPAMRSVVEAPPLYYPGAPAATAPVYGAAPSSPASPYTTASPYASPAYGAPPASTYAPSSPPAPGTATPYYGASLGGGSAAPGDAITAPTDAGPLRFASPGESSLARQEAQPVPRAGSSQFASTTTAPPRPATASGWIAGSAPVRTDSLASAPRVRMPGEGLPREPVSLAALGGVQQVPIAPLEPAPTGVNTGGGAPLRVATPSSSTGWR